MKIKTIKKPLLQRLLKTKNSKKKTQTADNKKVIQEQDCSATHLEEIAKMSNTNDTELQLAHIIFFHHQNPSNTWKRDDRKGLHHTPAHKARILHRHFKKQFRWSHKE